MSTPDDRFVDALLERHAAPMRRPEFLKAIRALSARYVERRSALTGRSPLDSDGKRAAFAAYYAPLHYLTVRAILGRLGAPHRSIARVVDLGCGTGVCGAAWCQSGVRPGSDGGQTGVRPGSDPGLTPAVLGIDQSGWSVTEAAWTYGALGISGRATRGDLVRAAESLIARNERLLSHTGVILGWSGNELDDLGRSRLRAALVELGRAGASILVVEPVSRRAAPWFDDWADAITKAGGRRDDWSFDEPRPRALSRLDRDAGFDRTALTARSLAINLP
jgi:hypothetical protein